MPLAIISQLRCRSMFLILITFVIIVQSYRVINNKAGFSRTALCVAGRRQQQYGNFFDQENVDIKGKKSSFQKSLNIDIENLVESTESSGYQSGDDLRKARERDLKTVKKEQEPVIPDTSQERSTKKTNEEIDRVIDCLNQSMGKGKSVGELTDNERVGLIDWAKFDAAAQGVIPDYVERGMQNTTRNWVEFHRKKNDIKFNLFESQVLSSSGDDVDASLFADTVPPLFSWAPKAFKRKNWRGRDAK
jgi:hypothetical protein